MSKSILVFVMVVLVAGNAQAGSIDSLVAYRPLDDNDSNTLVLDISGNGHNGTASANTDTFNDTGKIDGCLIFGGDKYATFTDHNELSFDDSKRGKFVPEQKQKCKKCVGIKDIYTK